MSDRRLFGARALDAALATKASVGTQETMKYPIIPPMIHAMEHTTS